MCNLRGCLGGGRLGMGGNILGTEPVPRGEEVLSIPL